MLVSFLTRLTFHTVSVATGSNMRKTPLRFQMKHKQRLQSGSDRVKRAQDSTKVHPPCIPGGAGKNDRGVRPKIDPVATAPRF